LYFEVVRFETGMITHSLMDDTCCFLRQFDRGKVQFDEYWYYCRL